MNLKVSGGNRTQNQFRLVEVPFFTKQLPEASDGAVTVNFSSLEDLGIQGPEVLRLLGMGMFDMSEGTLSYMAGEAPLFESLDFPGLTSDIDQQRKMAEGLKPEIAKTMKAKFGVKLLSLAPIALQVLYCNKPVSSLADIKGLKVRTFNRGMAQLVEGLGAQSVNIPFAEVVPAMERGVADCAITATSAGNTARWWEVSDHLVMLPMGWSMIFFGANADNWNKLPEKTQAFLEKQFSDMEDKQWAQAKADVQDGINCNTGKGTCKNGIEAKPAMKLVTLTSDEKDHAREILTKNVLSDWAKRCGSDCVSQWNENAGKVVGVHVSDN
ncbi:TRAP transporter substrate-binding protein [Pararhizobium mangrovi]|uniref:TRAP transporter substrate-binding protein n=1 Tax=Pararhizobium mangrovi TaxID=2590452 RepID=UPI0015E82DB6|nr:TRAP transporter substrate-binding protein [Pararhizobium mangrovi]